LRPQHVDWFNANANPHDIARADHIRMAGVLDQVTAGRKLIVFKSIEDAERIIPYLNGNIDIIGYNLEHGPNNPAGEQASPVESVRRMSELAHEYGLKLAMGPDRSFALDLGVQMAPYVDIFILQVQRAQTQPETVRSFVKPLVSQLRAANPDIEVSVQIRTEGDVEALAALIDSLRDDLDGVSILTNPDPETVYIASDLVAALRRQLGLVDPNAAAAPVDPALLLPTPTLEEADASSPGSTSAEIAPTAPPSPAASVPTLAPLQRQADPDAQPAQSWPFTLLALGVAGGSILIVTLMFILQQRNPR
jgi:hypothetical protein